MSSRYACKHLAYLRRPSSKLGELFVHYLPLSPFEAPVCWFYEKVKIYEKYEKASVV